MIVETRLQGFDVVVSKLSGSQDPFVKKPTPILQTNSHVGLH